MTHDATVAKSNNRRKEVRALEARLHILGAKLNLLKRCESPNCDMEVITRKVADTQDNITNMVTGLHRNTVRSYDSIRRGSRWSFSKD